MSSNGSLTKVLGTLGLEDLKVEVYPTAPGKVMVVLTSPTFAGMEEEERQRRVWDAIAQALPEAEQVTIEFVFTNAPGEDTSESDG